MKKCKRCGSDFEPKNPKGKFCSDKCKVYWHREGKKENRELTEFASGVSLASLRSPEVPQKPSETKKVAQSTQKPAEVKIEPKNVSEQIAYFETEKAKLVGDGDLAKSMRFKYDKKIAELKKQLI